MSSYLRVAAAACLAAGVLAIAASGQKMLQNPSYLSQFPTPDRIKAEMKGTDEVDSYDRLKTPDVKRKM